MVTLKKMGFRVEWPREPLSATLLPTVLGACDAVVAIANEAWLVSSAKDVELSSAKAHGLPVFVFPRPGWDDSLLPGHDWVVLDGGVTAASRMISGVIEKLKMAAQRTA